MGTLLQFPERDRGRKRRRKSLSAMGDCSLFWNNAPVPPNVARLAAARNKAGFDDAELSLLLSLGIFAVLTPEQQKSLRGQLRELDLGHGDQRAAVILDMIGRA